MIAHSGGGYGGLVTNGRGVLSLKGPIQERAGIGISMAGIQQRSQIVESVNVLRADSQGMAKCSFSLLGIVLTKVSRSQVVVGSRCAWSQTRKFLKHRQRAYIVPGTAVSNAEKVIDVRVGCVGAAIVF